MKGLDRARQTVVVCGHALRLAWSSAPGLALFFCLHLH